MEPGSTGRLHFLTNAGLGADEIEQIVAHTYVEEVVDCERWTVAWALREIGVPNIDLLKIDGEKSEIAWSSP